MSTEQLKSKEFEREWNTILPQTICKQMQLSHSQHDRPSWTYIAHRSVCWAIPARIQFDLLTRLCIESILQIHQRHLTVLRKPRSRAIWSNHCTTHTHDKKELSCDNTQTLTWEVVVSELGLGAQSILLLPRWLLRRECNWLRQPTQITKRRSEHQAQPTDARHCNLPQVFDWWFAKSRSQHHDREYHGYTARMMGFRWQDEPCQTQTPCFEARSTAQGRATRWTRNSATTCCSPPTLSIEC